MVTFQFEDTPSVDEVRSALADEFESSISLEQLSVEREDGSVATLFRLRTIEQDARKVAQAINQAFADSPHELVRQRVEVGQIEPRTSAVSSNGEAGSAGSENGASAAGHQVTLTFAEPLDAIAVVDKLADALGTVKTQEGAPKYEDSATLLGAVNVDDPETLTSDGREFTVTAGPDVSKDDLQAALSFLESDISTTPNFEEVNNFDSSVAGETQVDAMLALFFSLLAIIGYLWFRFQRVTFGLAVAAAIVHDVLFVLGSVSLAAYLSGNPVGNLLALEDFKINMPMLAAFLTLVGYSLNDTIVVFDRVREVRGKNPAITAEMINLSLNQTLSRTLLTGFTTLLVVVILYVFGGEGIHGFAYCLLIGMIVGTYSTIYIAAPALLWLMNRKPATR
jgi:SecD/SecF fusion protein